MEGKRIAIHWFTPQTGSGLGQSKSSSQELNLCLPGGARNLSTWGILSVFLSALAGSWTREQAVFELVPTWDAGREGNSFTHCATMLDPYLILVLKQIISIFL